MENFKARIMQELQNLFLPMEQELFSGKIRQIDLNKAALLDINEVNRDEFIAVAGF